MRLAAIECQAPEMARLGDKASIDPSSLVQATKELRGLKARLGPDGDDPRLSIELQGSDPSEILTTIREVLLTLARYSSMK